jgi:Zn-dependent protease with chaperone function
VAFAVIGSLLDLPWEVARTFGLESRFGFNRLTPRMFVVDLIKNTLVGAVLMLPLALLVLWIMQVAGGWWWLWAWAGLTAFSLLMMVAYPLVIAPLFNKFQPLPDGEVKTRAQALMQRCDFALSGLFVMDGSRRSAHANAYFTGMGAARRVVLFDTLLGQLSPAQIEGVLAHEVGHYKRRHILKRMVVMFGSVWRALRCWAGCRIRCGSTSAWASCPICSPPTMHSRSFCSVWRCRCLRCFSAHWVRPLRANMNSRPTPTRPSTATPAR